MSSSRKRSAPHPLEEPTAKHHHKDPIVISDDEDEESLESILAQIKEQDESEALAKRLQQEWNTADTSVASHPVASSSRLPDEDEIMAIDLSDAEDDEALTRLAKEWEEIPSDNDLTIISAPLKPTLYGDSSRSKVKNFDTSPLIDKSTPDQKLRRCSEMFVSDRTCSMCQTALPSPRGHVVFSSDNCLPSLLILLHAPCRKCKINHCRGCMSPIACPINCKGPEKNPGCAVDGCCAQVRALALFEALGGFDRQFLGEKASSAQRSRVPAQKRRTTASAVLGTGYGTDQLSGLLHGDWHSRGSGKRNGSRKEASVANSSSSFSHSNNIATNWEEIIVRAFTTFTKYLPDPYSDSAQAYDMVPHESIYYLLVLSQLPELLGSLLRNDSVSDWISRCDTYRAMLLLLRRMADCELTVDVLISEGWEIQYTPGLQEWMWGDGDIKWERSEKGEIVRPAPLYNHFRKLTKQCETFLSGASRIMDREDADGEVDEMAVKGSSMCTDIIATRDDMDRLIRTLGKLNRDGLDGNTNILNVKGKGKDSLLLMEQCYAQECERLAFQHIDLSDSDGNNGLSFKDFNYWEIACKSAGQTRMPKDRLHLVKELAVTATCLPPGIWIRVDEVRNDVIKIMIAGPDNTPYAGGLFEFDCFLPIEYPNKPPLMHLRTTGGGQVRFNPNLYSNGKVCLSLLGTWPGRPEESWQPRKSTLLQVLVSIQSMILNDAPYFNEPGYGVPNLKNPRSIEYNREIRLQTTRYAIIEWIKDDKYKHDIWRDVIASHFSIRNEKIRNSLRDWASQDGRFSKYTAKMALTTEGSMGMLNGLKWNPEALDDDTMDEHLRAYYNSPGRKKGRAPTGRDLLAEYDLGIKNIAIWSRKIQPVLV